MGTFAVQLAKAFGAEVTAVCSTRNVAAARALGAHVVDYTAGDRSIAVRRRVLRSTGVLVVVSGHKDTGGTAR